MTVTLPIRFRRRMPFGWLWGVEAGEWLDRKFNRDKRSQKARFFRGVVATVLMIFAGLLIGRGVHIYSHGTYGWIFIFIFLAVTMHGSLAFVFLAQSARVLKRGDKNLMRVLLGIFGRSPAEFSDIHGLGRQAVELGAWLLNRVLVGPAFWFLLAGAEGLAIYVAAAALDQAIGITDDHHRFFGWTAAKLDDALNFFPARLTALLIAFAALFVSRASPRQALRVALDQARTYPALNAGWPLAAMAGAVGVTLAGPRSEGDSGIVPPCPWIGAENASAKVEILDVLRAKWIAGIVFFIALALVSTVFYLKYK